MKTFTGLIPPICTPLTSDGDVDQASLRALIDSQVAAGAAGIFVLGSSGEAIYLTDQARRTVIDVAVEAVNGRIQLLVGALESTPSRVIDQARRVDGSRVDGIVVTAPFYANLSACEVALHFRAIADAVSVPVLAYDIPGNVGRRIDADTLIELLGDGTIAGLKDSSGSLTEFRIILDALGPERSAAMLTGADILADLALTLGADGLIPGLANIRPDLFIQLLNAHAAGQTKRVAAYQRAITALTAIFGAGQRYGLGRHASELGALKHFLHAQGIIKTTTVSAPLTPYPAEGLADLDRIHARIEDRLQQDLEETAVLA